MAIDPTSNDPNQQNTIDNDSQDTDNSENNPIIALFSQCKDHVSEILQADFESIREDPSQFTQEVLEKIQEKLQNETNQAAIEEKDGYVVRDLVKDIISFCIGVAISIIATATGGTAVLIAGIMGVGLAALDFGLRAWEESCHKDTTSKKTRKTLQILQGALKFADAALKVASSIGITSANKTKKNQGSTRLLQSAIGLVCAAFIISAPPVAITVAGGIVLLISVVIIAKSFRELAKLQEARAQTHEALQNLNEELSKIESPEHFTRLSSNFQTTPQKSGEDADRAFQETERKLGIETPSSKQPEGTTTVSSTQPKDSGTAQEEEEEGETGGPKCS